MPVFGACLLSGARNHDTLSRQMIPAGKEKEMYSNVEKFKNDDVLAFRLLKKFKRKKQPKLNASPFLFTNKQVVLSSAQTDQSQFSFLAGFRWEIWWEKNLAPEKYDRLTSFWYQLTGTRNRPVGDFKFRLDLSFKL